MIIRPAKHSDASQLIDAHRGSIRQVCAKDYTPEQIEAWAGRKFEEAQWISSIDTEHVWVIEYNDKVAGFGHLSSLQVDLVELRGLYFLPEVIGHGLGKKLMALIFRKAQELGARRMKLHATITALTFYESLGFKKVECSTTSVQMQGVTIPCHPMEKNL